MPCLSSMRVTSHQDVQRSVPWQVFGKGGSRCVPTLPWRLTYAHKQILRCRDESMWSMFMHTRSRCFDFHAAVGTPRMSPAGSMLVPHPSARLVMGMSSVGSMPTPRLPRNEGDTGVTKYKTVARPGRTGHLVVQRWGPYPPRLSQAS